MHPTLRQGDVIISVRATAPPRRGQIVVFRDPTGRDPLVKRVIALPGDHILVLETELQLNGRTLDEPYADHRGITLERSEIVPAGHVWLMGDNRADSLDSREFGPVEIERIESHVTHVLISRTGPRIDRMFRRPK